MNPSPSREYPAAKPTPGWPLYAAVLAAMLSLTGLETACAVTISNTPLYLGTSALPNVLLTLSNAQNMDENGNPANGIPIGAAIGGSSPDSKSEIARGVIRNLSASYAGQINLGLMTFKQNTPGSLYLYNSLYDASYDPANYQASPTVAKDSPLKNYRITNPADTANYIYYNWASPFYDSGLYPYNFCYSDTAKFDNTTNISSPDYYRCFTSKTGTSDTIPATPGSKSDAVISTDESNAGYSVGNAGTYTGLIYWGSSWPHYYVPFGPTDTDYATNTLDFGARIPSIYTSTAWFSSGSPGGGYLQVPVAPLTSTQQTTLNNKLTCNVPTAPGGAPNPNPTPTSGACNSNSSPTGSSILNAGLTAIEGTLKANQLYFSGGTSSAQGFASNTLPNSCNKNFAVLLTNGLPSVTSTGTIPKLSNGQIDICTLTSQAVAAAASLKSSGVNLYVIGYAMLPQVLQNYTALCGSANPNPLDQLASAGGTGTSYSASNPAQLQTALNGVFANIVQSAGSSSALTSNSTSINSNSYLYQASFNSADWSGHLKAFQVTSAGPSSMPTWDAANLMPAAASRSIYTWSGSAGANFSWANLTANEQCYLASQASGCTLTAAQVTTGQNVLNYLRGDASLQQSSGGGYRNRSTPLGDIVDSNPLYLSNEDYGYSILSGSEGSSYATYVQNKTSNIPMLYVGANDGMLHGFNASTGMEVFAYVPRAVYPHLADLTQPTYNGNHEFFVDGSPGSGDAYYGSAWHTILLGTLGSTSGTNTVFAMDVTNPGSMSASKALWEFSDANDLGKTWGEATVARFNDGNYYAVVNNGYNSVNKHAVLFLIQVNNPTNVIKIDTGVGGGTVDNGLSQPALLDADNNGTIDAIYAGDLQGNVWKFDVSNSHANQWGVAYTSGSTKLPLFKAVIGTTVQPITAPVILGSVPSGADGTALVFFGTGQYLNTVDLSNTATQSLYGVLDSSEFSSGAFSGGTSNFSRTTQVNGANVLVQQSIVFENSQTRAVTTNSVDYTNGNLGWYMDLLQPPSATQQGERVISKALIRSGRVLFTTLIPSSGICTYGGSGWTMELDAPTGGAPGAPFLDMNNDGQYDSSDNVSVNGSSAVAVGVKITGGFGTTPVSSTNGGSYTTTVGISSGGMTKTPNAQIIQGSPRASWSQIK
ncbi:MAG TPA: PilC/PilY family type IV pilus protein [Sulfuriferula sp.]|nr:PilC/PilY family type IV pilus protein [Sulfuriferula sp.]